MKITPKHLVRALTLLFVVLSSASAVSSSGWLVGKISGRTRLLQAGGETAALADVTVMLTDLGWGKVWTELSDERGRFQFLNLRPGDYVVEVEKAGHRLKRVRRESIIRLRVNDPVRILPAYDLIPTGQPGLFMSFRSQAAIASPQQTAHELNSPG